MTEKICSNCKYWEGEYNAGECCCPKFVCPDSVGNDAAEIEIDGIAQYRNGMSGLFITGREFGCIHFKEKRETLIFDLDKWLSECTKASDFKNPNSFWRKLHNDIMSIKIKMEMTKTNCGMEIAIKQHAHK